MRTAYAFMVTGLVRAFKALMSHLWRADEGTSCHGALELGCDLLEPRLLLADDEVFRAMPTGEASHRATPDEPLALTQHIWSAQALGEVFLEGDGLGLSADGRVAKGRVEQESRHQGQESKKPVSHNRSSRDRDRKDRKSS
jgi:hypothetical protein